MRYCPDCKYFIACCLDKMAYYKIADEDCPEYTERINKDNENQSKT